MTMNKKEKLRKFNEKNVYCITAEKYSKGRDNVTVVKNMLDAGVKIIQYREKYKNFREKYEECLIIRKLTAKKDAVFIVNDHPDLCLMTDADGVHLGQDDYPLKAVREILGNDYILGVSTHSPEQYMKAVADGADYAGVGPLFETHTKDDVMAPVGLKYLKWVFKHEKIPFVAIGGIKECNVEKVVKAGAKCICLVTEITSADDIKEKIKKITEKINL
ncbi:MAG TPA: thiamine phosphate synthase [Candidatus Goldiibacteriota bacterium]|nr:thiamine phosphate synthase [Candidatus Goldiibacteriota bacterium]